MAEHQQPMGDELLSRYLDQDLSRSEKEAVEAALRSDDSLRERLEVLRRNDNELCAAFEDRQFSALPYQRHAKIESMLIGASARSRAPNLPQAWWPRAIAASLVIFALGAASGFVASNWQQDRLMAQIEALRESDRLVIRQVVDEVLETSKSGMAASWTNPQSGASGTVTPLRTFRNLDGRWCREFQLLEETVSGAVESRTIACRDNQGQWVRQVTSTTVKALEN